MLLDLTTIKTPGILLKMEKYEEVQGNADLQQKICFAEEKVESLQEVITKLQMTKKFLHLNAVEVKASIHSNISRLLESMRSREVWLLNQVDVVLQAKEDGLRRQEDQLNQAIGRLSNCLSLLDGGATLSSELNDILCRIDSLGKHPVESPHISFRADIASLRQAVHGFGRVDSKGLPLEAFASPHLCSSSLPKSFEDYEDDDHHVFYKSVHEIHEKKHGRSVIFNIPKLSADLPSWVSPTHKPAAERAAIAAGLKSKSAAAASERKKPTTACSVSQWMQEIKMEEEGDELMTSQLGSRYGGKGIVTSASASSLISGSRSETPTFKSVKMEKVPQLSRSTEMITGKDEDNTRSRLNYFSFLSPRLQDWLIDGDSRLPKNKVSEAQPLPVAFAPFVFKPSSDVATKENVMESYKKKMMAMPVDSWLAPSAESSKLESENGSSLLENYLKKIDLLPWLISYRGVAKDLGPEFESKNGNGIIENYARRISNLSWLANGKESESVKGSGDDMPNPEPGSKAAEGVLEDYIRKLASKSWLLAQGEEEMPEHTEKFFNYMTKISNSSTDHWVLSREGNSAVSSSPRGSSDVILDHTDELDFRQEEKSEPVSSDSVERVDGAELKKYYSALNSFPTEYWLLSAPTENASQ